VTYLSLRDDTFETNCDEGAQDQVTWTDPDGRAKSAPLPRITFTRATARSVSGSTL